MVEGKSEKKVEVKQGTSALNLILQAKKATPNGTVQEFVDQEVGGIAMLARTGYGQLPVYKLTATGAIRTAINIQSIFDVLSSPWYSAECPDCGSDQCMYETNIRGEKSTFQCEGKPPKQFRVCPVRTCRKRVFDPVPAGKYRTDEWDNSAEGESYEDSEYAIKDDFFKMPDPESRTKAALNMHIIGYHPATAMELGIGKAAEMPRLTVTT